MTIIFKHWTRLGLGAALSGVALSACTPDEPAPAAETTAPAESPMIEPLQDEIDTESRMGGFGEGGEGEGGVAISEAATNPVIFRSALAIAGAHVIAARDAFAEGQPEAAAEMFAHPVSEVLLDMEPVLRAQGVESFDQLLLDASGAVFEGESEAEIAARTDEILAALSAAASKAPQDGSSAAEIAMGVIADQVERASDMYRVALETAEYEPYLDGYGFYRAGEAIFAREDAAIEATSPTAAAAIRSALAALAEAYPSAAPQDELGADPAALAVAASNVVLETSN